MTKNIFFSLLDFGSSLILAFFVSPLILNNSETLVMASGHCLGK